MARFKKIRSIVRQHLPEMGYTHVERENCPIGTYTKQIFISVDDIMEKLGKAKTLEEFRDAFQGWDRRSYSWWDTDYRGAARLELCDALIDKIEESGRKLTDREQDDIMEVIKLYVEFEVMLKGR